jgi:hypothetical protein
MNFLSNIISQFRTPKTTPTSVPKTHKTTLNDLTPRTYGQRAAIHTLVHTVPTNESCLIVGPTGSCKSLLLEPLEATQDDLASASDPVRLVQLDHATNRQTSLPNRPSDIFISPAEAEQIDKRGYRWVYFFDNIDHVSPVNVSYLYKVIDGHFQQGSQIVATSSLNREEMIIKWGREFVDPILARLGKVINLEEEPTTETFTHQVPYSNFVTGKCGIRTDTYTVPKRKPAPYNLDARIK